MIDPAELSYDRDGLLPAIVQDAGTGEVLMVGHVNEETLRTTLQTGQAVFWSRTRQEVWHKGATSGDFVQVLDIVTNCDGGAIVMEVHLLGDGICHTGAHSCFVEEDDETPRTVLSR